MTAQTPIYGIKYIQQGEPVRNTRQALEDNAFTIETALAARGVTPPNVTDLVALSGRVTTAENGRALPRVTARRSTAQSISGGTLTAIAFDVQTTRSSSGMWAATAATRLIAPEAGEYDLSLTIPWAVTAASAGALSSGFRVNSVAASMFYLATHPTNVWFGSEQSPSYRGLELNANDYVEICVLQNTDPSRNVGIGARATLALARR